MPLGLCSSSQDQMGFSPFTGGCVRGGSNVSNNFTFRKRQERIDWRKIAGLDLDLISRDLDFEALQDNIANVAFCNIECELDRQIVDPNYIKLFRLAQLIIEYLLHSQDYLSHTIVTLEEKYKTALENLSEEKKTSEMGQYDLKTCKAELKKLKRRLCIQEKKSGIDCYFPCPFCPKVFMTDGYLRSHFQKRHPNFTPNPPTYVAEIIESLEKELKCIKEKLNSTENQLKEERTVTNCAKDDILCQKLEVWKLEQLDAHKKEIENIRDLFMSEMRDLNNKYQTALNNLEQLKFQQDHFFHSGPSSPPQQACPVSPLINISKENCNDNKDQRQRELCQLRKQLASHIDSVVCERLQNQELKIHQNLKHMWKTQNENIGKMSSLILEKIEKGDCTKNELIQTICDQMKKHEKRMKLQQKKISELCELQKTPEKVKYDQQPQRKKRRSDGSGSSGRRFQNLLKSRNFYMSRRSQESGSQPFIRSTRLAAVLDRDPSLVKGLRDEISCLINDKLDRNRQLNQNDLVRDDLHNSSQTAKSPKFEKPSTSKHHLHTQSFSDSELSLNTSLEKDIIKAKHRLKNYKDNTKENKEIIRKLKKHSSLGDSMHKFVSSLKSMLKRSSQSELQDHTILAQDHSDIKSNKTEENQLKMQDTQKTKNSEEEIDDDSDSEEDDEEVASESEIELEKQKGKLIKINSAQSQNQQTKFQSESESQSSSEWESGSELEEISKSKLPATNVVNVRPQQSSTNISANVGKSALSSSDNYVSSMAKSLEIKLNVPRTKPFGGVATVPSSFSNKKPVESTVMTVKDIEISSDSSDDDELPINKEPGPSSSRGENENSSNTYATSVWGSFNSKQLGSGKQSDYLSPSGTASSHKALSSSWDSEDDGISKIK